MAPTLSIRTATAEEAEEYFHGWAVSEGWNPGIKDDVNQVFYNLDPEGFYVGTIADEENPDKQKVVAIVSNIRYGKDSSFLGYYIVAPEYRGKGFGLVMFQHALSQVKDRPCVGLDAVEEQVSNYQKSGFTVTAWRNERRTSSTDALVEKLASYETLEGKTILNASDVPIEQLYEMEERYNGWSRPVFVSEWVKFHTNSTQHGRFSVAVMEKGKVLGYGCTRPGVKTIIVGPLYAESPDVAKAILYKLAKLANEALTNPDNNYSPSIENIMDLDIASVNSQALTMFDELGMPNEFSTWRMWKGRKPEVDTNGIYALTSVAIG
jgi:GNAT superfamily N-acetyltransferase